MRLNKHPVLICACLSFILGLFLWTQSQPPPYGSPGQEANMFWMQLVYIAHEWRSLHFAFWNNEVGGGLSTFTSCQFPLLNPLNTVALILNDDQFCILHLIMPYVTGFFFTVLLLKEVFEVSWAMAIFGGLFYLGLPISSTQTILPESPLTLWGCFLLPGALYAYFKLNKKNILLAWGLVGAFLAFHFASSGATTFPQSFIWWICFLAITGLADLKQKSVFSNLLEKASSLSVMVFMAIGLFALQFIPLFTFVSHESGRRLNTYAANSFPFSEISDLFTRAIFPTGITPEILLALACFVLALGLTIVKGSFNQIKNARYFLLIAFSTILYILLPDIISALSSIGPLKHLLQPLHMFTFRYAANTMDLSLIVGLTLLLNAAGKRTVNAAWRHVIEITALALVIGTSLLIFPMMHAGTKPVFMLGYALAKKFFYVLLLLITSAILLGRCLGPQQPSWAMRILTAGLIVLAFYSFFDGYNWGDKGKRTSLSQYDPSAPEYQFFKSARDKYFLPYDMPESMGDCFPLVYNVWSTTGFYAAPSRRFSDFMAAYHNDKLAKGEVPVVHFEIISPSQSLTSYFPVDFTTIGHGKTLPWSNFEEAVSGTRYDIWTRKDKPARVLFAHHLRTSSFADILRQFDTPYNGTLHVSPSDALRWKLSDTDLPSGTSSVEDWHYDNGKISFKVDLSQGTFVMVPFMFQNGWKASIDGQRTGVFAADDIFIGLRVPAGEHQVCLKFSPPGLALGILMNILAILLLTLLVLREHSHSLHKVRQSPR